MRVRFYRQWFVPRKSGVELAVGVRSCWLLLLTAADCLTSAATKDTASAVRFHSSWTVVMVQLASLVTCLYDFCEWRRSEEPAQSWTWRQRQYAAAWSLHEVNGYAGFVWLYLNCRWIRDDGWKRCLSHSFEGHVMAWYYWHSNEMTFSETTISIWTRVGTDSDQDTMASWRKMLSLTLDPHKWTKTGGYIQSMKRMPRILLLRLSFAQFLCSECVLHNVMWVYWAVWTYASLFKAEAYSPDVRGMRQPARA